MTVAAMKPFITQQRKRSLGNLLSDIVLIISLDFHGQSQLVMCFFHLLQSILRRYASVSPIPFGEDEQIPLHVRFDKVEIREHALILGEHPYCRDGLCLELDWKHSHQTRVVSINAFEYENWGRPPLRAKTISERQERLKKAGGYSLRELRKAHDNALMKLDELVEH